MKIGKTFSLLITASILAIITVGVGFSLRLARFSKLRLSSADRSFLTPDLTPV